MYAASVRRWGLPSHVGVVLVLGLGGCYGQIGDRRGGAAGAGGGRAGGQVEEGAGGDGAGGNGGAPAASCSGRAELGVAPWHPAPLTREQYINAASDLLGFDVRPLATFSDVGGRKYTPGVSLTDLQVEERLEAAEAIAAEASSPAHLAGLLPCDRVKVGDAECASQLVAQLGTRAFRRPLSPEATSALRQLFDAGNAARGFATGVEWLVAGVLQSPDFLYQLSPRPAQAQPRTVVPLDDHTLASRLAFFLWNSAPDPELLSAAAGDGLRTPAAVAAQVRRLLGDPRSARMREDFYGSWLELDGLREVARDAPEFTPALAGDLRRSALAGIHALYRGDAQVDQLLRGTSVFGNPALAKVYGWPAGGAELAPVEPGPGQRYGILTHPALLALLAATDASDPIKRGVFVQEKVLCNVLPDPIPDIPDLPPLRPGLSTRQRLEQHRAAPACAGCHKLFDPIGLAFENYDAIGRYRQMDQGVTVDSSGELSEGDLGGAFANGRELFARIAGSATVRACMVTRWFEYAVSRAMDPVERCGLAPLVARFQASGDLVDLLASIAESDAFRMQLVED